LLEKSIISSIFSVISIDLYSDRIHKLTDKDILEAVEDILNEYLPRDIDGKYQSVSESVQANLIRHRNTKDYKISDVVMKHLASIKKVKVSSTQLQTDVLNVVCDIKNKIKYVLITIPKEEISEEEDKNLAIIAEFATKVFSLSDGDKIGFSPSKTCPRIEISEEQKEFMLDYISLLDSTSGQYAGRLHTIKRKYKVFSRNSKSKNRKESKTKKISINYLSGAYLLRLINKHGPFSKKREGAVSHYQIKSEMNSTIPGEGFVKTLFKNIARELSSNVYIPFPSSVIAGLYQITGVRSTNGLMSMMGYQDLRIGIHKLKAVSKFSVVHTALNDKNGIKRTKLELAQPTKEENINDKTYYASVKVLLPLIDSSSQESVEDQLKENNNYLTSHTVEFYKKNSTFINMFESAFTTFSTEVKSNMIQKKWRNYEKYKSTMVEMSKKIKYQDNTGLVKDQYKDLPSYTKVGLRKFFHKKTKFMKTYHFIDKITEEIYSQWKCKQPFINTGSRHCGDHSELIPIKIDRAVYDAIKNNNLIYFSLHDSKNIVDGSLVNNIAEG